MATVQLVDATPVLASLDIQRSVDFSNLVTFYEPVADA